MLTKQEAIDLQDTLLAALGGPAVSSPGEGGRVPRPALLPFRDMWRDQNLRKALEPKLQRGLTVEDLHEVFAGFIEQFVIDGYRQEHPFTYVRDALGVDPKCVANLFPSRTKESEETMPASLAYSMAIILYCAFIVGGQILYGEDWALVIGEDYAFGIDQGKAVTQYEFCNVEVPSLNWKRVYEGYRDSGNILYPEHYSLYRRSSSQANRQYENYMEVARILIWAGRPFAGVLHARLYLEDADRSLDRYIAHKTLRTGHPIESLRGILVPKFASARQFNDAVEPYLIDELFWGSEETLDFVQFMLRRFNIVKNNKKGKTHVNRTQREGPLR